jgi:hypothetical protein
MMSFNFEVKRGMCASDARYRNVETTQKQNALIKLYLYNLTTKVAR